MNKQNIAIVAHGALHEPHRLAARLKKYQQIIAVDGGLHYCDAMGIRPDLIVGDLDSVSKELLDRYQDVPIHRLPIHKDETDLECALNLVLNSGSQKITLFAVLEKRTDHALGNLHILRRYPGKVFIETENEFIFAIKGSAEVACAPGQTISLIPMGGPVTGVTTKGLKWELNHASFDQNFLSISNICLGSSFQISIQTGDLVCIMQT